MGIRGYGTQRTHGEKKVARLLHLKKSERGLLSEKYSQGELGCCAATFLGISM